MAVRAVTLAPLPAAGQDWRFVVPAQWLPYFYGVTAMLTTALPFTTLTDETGNGHTATLGTFVPVLFGVQGPYAAGVGNYCVQGNDPNAVAGAVAVTGQFVDLNPAAFTVMAWSVVPTRPLLPSSGLVTLKSPGNAVLYDISGANEPPPATYRFGVTFSGSFQFSTNLIASEGVFHHVAISWDGAQWVFYIDGVAAQTVVGHAPPVGGGTQGAVSIGGASGIVQGKLAGFAMFNVALTQPQIAGCAAANGSYAAYKTAVLALTPTALWGLNTVPAGPSRIVTLKITDGTNTVGQFPASFAAATAQSFIWSWQVLGPGAQSSTDGLVNSVAIPEVAVDAGYVISSVTLDLAGTDRWGPVTLWFDDGTGPVGGPSGGLAQTPYLNALLVPDYSHRSLP